MERELDLVLLNYRYAPLTTFPPHPNKRGNGEGAGSVPLVQHVYTSHHLPATPEQERELALVLSYCRYALLTTFLPHPNKRGNGEGAGSVPLVLHVYTSHHLPATPEQERKLALVLSYCRYALLTTFLPHLNRRENGEEAGSGPLVL
jgi:hypothetical protein